MEKNKKNADFERAEEERKRKFMEVRGGSVGTGYVKVKDDSPRGYTWIKKEEHETR